MFAIGIRYLMGWAVATDIAKRNPPEEPEWPVHPARVFMALAAAHFETPWDEQHDSERMALQWLEDQMPPNLVIPRGEVRSPVTCYVPVNDRNGLESLPTRRPKQARTFPRVILEDETVYLIWPDAVVPGHHRIALDSVCSKVTRIGHSSSFVQAWVEYDRKSPQAAPNGNQFVPDYWERSESYERLMRVPAPGTLENLRRWYNSDSLDAWADLQMKFQSATANERKLLKVEIEERFGGRMPRSQRPILRAMQGYSRLTSPRGGSVCKTVFDDELLILSKVDGPNLGLESTVQLTAALRGTILSLFPTEADTPEWISGHRTDRSPSQEAHLALIPLAYVGPQYADGHLLGAAIVFPRHISPRDRVEPLRPLFTLEADGTARLPVITMGRLGEWTLVRETRPFAARALQRPTWTEPSDVWATVTPIVLDRYPKADRLADRKAWILEVAGIIASSCRNIGLPEPIAIDIDKTSWHRGVPRAIPGKTGFPMFPVRNFQSPRAQVHAWLQFDQPVRGPVIVGAGRYLGYGLCKPLPALNSGTLEAGADA